MKKQILTFYILLAFVSAFGQSWKSYPHHQQGSVLTFPDDEGWHPGVDVEWWYTNAHVKGNTTGTDYSFMLTYFYFDTLGFDGFRIFNIANDNTGEFLQQTMPCMYPNISQSHCEIHATVGLLPTHAEEWITRKDSSGDLIPFQYHLKASSDNGAIDVTYNTIKRPLMVGGTGYLLEGESDWTYYYSQTMLEVTGTITFKGVTEGMSGTAWIDRQWGDFNPNRGPKYEWFSLQLSNGMDLNLWNIFTAQNEVPDTSTYRFCSIYVNDSTDMTISDFDLERLEFEFTPDLSRCYSKKWRLTFGNTDLTFSTLHQNAEVLLPFRFIEGKTLITGTVNGVPVTGIGFAELLHPYAHPQINLVYPAGTGGEIFSGSQPLSWQLINPDDAMVVYYDVEISTDNKASYSKIAQGLTAASYNWTSGLALGEQVWMRVLGYSKDSTLHGIKEAANYFTIGVTGIDEHATHNNRLLVTPNPLHTGTKISYQLSNESKVKLDIFDVKGKVVKSLFEGNQLTGDYSFDWENNISAGIYYCRLQTEFSIETQKLCVIK